MSGMRSPKVLAVQKIAVTNHTAVITVSQKMARGKGAIIRPINGTKLEKKKSLIHSFKAKPSLQDSISRIKFPDVKFLNLDLSDSDL